MLHELVTTQFSDEFLVLCSMALAMGIVLSIVFAVVTLINAIYRRKTQLDDMAATLKMEMIQRGMPVEDIERVLGAKMGSAGAMSAAGRNWGCSSRKLGASSQRAPQS